MSRETDLFGQSSQVIGRICTASMTINASSIPSTEVIYETFRLEFSGTIRLNETCRGSNSSNSVIHTISSPATIVVPILCSIESKEFSCGAVLIRSGDTKLVHTTHHRTVVIQDSLVEDEVKITTLSSGAPMTLRPEPAWDHHPGSTPSPSRPAPTEPPSSSQESPSL